MRRYICKTLLGACLGLALAVPAAAQQFPAKPLRLLVGFSAGGSTDVIAREYANELSKSLGQPVIVENRVGANGIIATDALAKAPPDGHTLLLAIPSNVTNAFAYSKLPYDPRKDFTPVSMIASAPLVLTVTPELGVNSLKELIVRAKANPGVINSGAAGKGSTPSLALELLAQMAGFKTTSVVFPGSAPQMLAMLRNDVQLGFVSTVQVLPYLKDNRLKALAVSSKTRHPLLPEVPSVDEAGVPGYESLVWYGIYAPPGTPAPIVDRLNAEFTRIAKLPSTRSRMEGQGADPAWSTPREFADFLAADFVKWEQVFKQNPMKLE